MKRETKMEKGITLIALLVTVSVLTILVAVAISGVKNDGIIAETKQSASDFEIAQEKENLQRVLLGWSIAEIEDLVDYLKNKYGEDKVQANVDESITIEVESGNRYIVTEDGEVTYVNGEAEQPETAPDIEPEISLTLDKTMITKEIISGSTATETISATLINATGTLTWTSSNTNVASISGSGSTRTITLKKAGTATITVSYGNYSTKCTITVTEKEPVLISFTLTTESDYNTITYYAEEGMTWGEWIGSDYDTSNGIFEIVTLPSGTVSVLCEGHSLYKVER